MVIKLSLSEKTSQLTQNVKVTKKSSGKYLSLLKMPTKKRCIKSAFVCFWSKNQTCNSEISKADKSHQVLKDVSSW